jgi:hypothetical protein
MTQVEAATVRGAYVEELKPEATKWAEHDVWILTKARRPGDAGQQAPEQAGGKRRVGVFIGINQFQDQRIPPLQAAAADARQMQRDMKRFGKLDQSFLLIDEQATLGEIRDTICSHVLAATTLGDTVILYFSTHGSRCKDIEGEEDDKLDEFLAVHDTRIDNEDTVRKTALMDDAFGRWLQALDGRKIIVVLDTCHSGGQAGGGAGARGSGPAKGAAPAKGFDPGWLPRGLAGTEFDFLNGEVLRAKDIGQRDAVLLAASMATERAFERPDRGLSVMTHFLLESLQAQPRLTVVDAYWYVRRKVPAYVAAAFPGMTQTPVLVPDDEANKRLLLRP